MWSSSVLIKWYKINLKCQHTFNGNEGIHVVSINWLIMQNGPIIFVEEFKWDNAHDIVHFGKTICEIMADHQLLNAIYHIKYSI